MGDSYTAYNLLEKMMLFENTDGQDEIENKIKSFVSRFSLNEFKKNIKILSMHLQRYKPSEWNNFFDVSMNVNEV